MFGRTLHVIDGISSRPELNGTLGLPVTYDEQKERYAVMLVSNQSRVLLKPGNLKPWLVEPAKGEPVTAVAIGTASVGKLLELIKAGAAHSQEDGIAEAVYTRALNLGGTDVRMRAELAAELYRGGGVEMLVQSMDAHMPDRRWPDPSTLPSSSSLSSSSQQPLRVFGLSVVCVRVSHTHTEDGAL